MQKEITVTLVLDDLLFRMQRKTLNSILSSALDLELLDGESEEVENLEGIISLLEAIADQAHDHYGMSTLLITDMDT